MISRKRGYDLAEDGKAVRDLKYESRVETRVFENCTRETRDRDSGIFKFLFYVLKLGQKAIICIDFRTSSMSFIKSVILAVHLCVR